ncbi:hypothetical protein ACFQZ4_11430 [Catellatospora coxensis]
MRSPTQPELTLADVTAKVRAAFGSGPAVTDSAELSGAASPRCGGCACPTAATWCSRSARPPRSRCSPTSTA